MIGIPILNCVDLLEECLNHIDVDEEIIIINNNNFEKEHNDKLWKLADTDDRLTVATQRYNLGCSGSWNALRKICCNEWLIIGSNDCFVHPGSIAKLRIRSEEIDANEENVGIIQISDYNFFAISKRCVRKVGLFDDSGGFYPAYCEDVDYSHRMGLANIRTERVGGANHLGSMTTRSEYNYANSRTYWETRRYYRQKWGGDIGNEKYTLPFGDKPIDYWVDRGEKYKRMRDWTQMKDQPIQEEKKILSGREKREKRRKERKC